METRQISNWNHLDRWGIRYLTGESDPYSLRSLCDLTEQSQDILKEYFSVPDMKFYPN